MTAPVEVKPCGTRAAYQRHVRRGEKPCEACREAEADYAASRHQPADPFRLYVPPHLDDNGWMDDAACAGFGPDMFFGGRGDNHDISEAKAVCADCPVREACLEYALVNEIHHGVWGGTSERQRRRLRRARKQVAA